MFLKRPPERCPCGCCVCCARTGFCDFSAPKSQTYLQPYQAVCAACRLLWPQKSHGRKIVWAVYSSLRTKNRMRLKLYGSMVGGNWGMFIDHANALTTNILSVHDIGLYRCTPSPMDWGGGGGGGGGGRRRRRRRRRRWWWWWWWKQNHHKIDACTLKGKSYYDPNLVPLPPETTKLAPWKILVISVTLSWNFASLSKYRVFSWPPRSAKVKWPANVNSGVTQGDILQLLITWNFPSFVVHAASAD